MQHGGPGGKLLEDETFIMASSRPSTNGSWFFLYLHSKPARSDGFHVVVLGKVKDGMNVVEAVECFESRNGERRRKLTGAGSGQSDIGSVYAS